MLPQRTGQTKAWPKSVPYLSSLSQGLKIFAAAISSSKLHCEGYFGQQRAVKDDLNAASTEIVLCNRAVELEVSDGLDGAVGGQFRAFGW